MIVLQISHWGNTFTPPCKPAVPMVSFRPCRLVHCHKSWSMAERGNGPLGGYATASFNIPIGQRWSHLWAACTYIYTKSDAFEVIEFEENFSPGYQELLLFWQILLYACFISCQRVECAQMKTKVKKRLWSPVAHCQEGQWWTWNKWESTFKIQPL